MRPPRRATRQLCAVTLLVISSASSARVSVWVSALAPAGLDARSQPHEGPRPAGGESRTGDTAADHAPIARQAADPHAASGQPGGHEGGGLWEQIARLVNFGVLAASLIYLLRSPVGAYLRGRREQVRRDLVNAGEMRDAANQRLEEIDRRLRELPAAIEALKARGAADIAAEEARIDQLGEAERQRLLDQTRREIELQLRIARRELVEQAAELVVGVAAERIKTTMTPEDHLRLVDKYVSQVKKG